MGNNISVLKIFKVLSLFITSVELYSQDTIRYEKLQSIGKINILITSIELYDDSSFTWTSEHDLSWSEYGIYTFNKDTLILHFYYSFFDNINKDSIDWDETKKTIEIKEVRKYLINKNKMHRIKTNGRLERWTNGRTMFNDKWRFLTFGYRKTWYVLR